METFDVVAVIDGNTFEVSPRWEFDGETGNRVQATGYNAPKSGKDAMAVEQKLSILIQNKKVDLGSPNSVLHGKLVCEVYFQGINLADYFPQYKQRDNESVEEQA